jgi:hypothetical protein
MTIRKGEPWGVAIERPTDLRVVDSDRAVAEAFSTDATGLVGVAAGDLHRAVGSPARRAKVQRLPIDVLVAHVIARGSRWRGRIVAAMNVDQVGEWNVAPRAHPNDGRFDVIDVDPAMTLRQRWQARARLRAGTHVPHPLISMRTATEMTWSFDRPLRLRVDDVDAGSVSTLSVTVRPDAFAIVV